MTNKKAIVIISISIFLVIAGVFAFWFFYAKDSDSGIAGLFPKGEDSGIFPSPDEAGNINEDRDGTKNDTTDPNSPNSGNQNSNQNTPGGQTNTGTKQPKLRKLSDTPVSGATIFKDKDGRDVVRYTDRAKGYIFEVLASGGNPSRISNTLLIKTYESLWADNGQTMIARFLKDDTDEILTYSAKLKSSVTSAENELEGYFLPKDIKSIAVAQNSLKNKVFFISPEESGGYSGIMAETDGSKKSIIFKTTLSEWIADWPETNTITLTTKASAYSTGHMYTLDPRSASLTKILSGIYGLTTLTNPDSTKVLYSESSEGSLSPLKVFDTKSLSVKQIPTKTLSEKCVWRKDKKTIVFCAIPKTLPTGIYPDSWYQGFISLNDDIWSIDVENDGASILASPYSLVDEDIDVINPTINQDGTYLVFMNKKDLSLWLLDMTN